MAKYDTIIFDLDGTTLDTLADLADSVNHALSQCGYPQRTYAEIRSFVGNGVANLMARAIPGGYDDPQFDSCFAAFRAHYELNMNNKTGPYAGIPELLEELKTRGYKMAIVSNKIDSAVKQLNEQFYNRYIQVAIGETENLQRKPAPDSVFKALEELGSVASNAVYVGDSEVDVQTARNAGMPCIAVTWGFRDKDVLEAEGAEYIIDSPGELMGILE